MILDFDTEVLYTQQRTVSNISLQLEWHRQLEDLGKLVLMKKDLLKKADKVQALIAAVKRYIL